MSVIGGEMRYGSDLNNGHNGHTVTTTSDIPTQDPSGTSDTPTRHSNSNSSSGNGSNRNLNGTSPRSRGTRNRDRGSDRGGDRGNGERNGNGESDLKQDVPVVSGISSIIINTAAMLSESIQFFVARTSLLQSVDNSYSRGTGSGSGSGRGSRSNTRDIEMSMSRSESMSGTEYLPIRTVSGDLDGGEEDF